MVTDAFMLIHPRIRSQPQHVVIDKACAAERARQYLPLRGSRVEPKAIGALDIHLHSIYTSSKDSNRPKEEREQALSLPGINAGVSRANS